VTGGTGAAEGSPTYQALAAFAPSVLNGLGLPQVFSPAEAAAVLRDAGLREMTECALRTRAYRKQVPFHRNGRRIVFTLGDLRGIVVGESCLPQHPDETIPTAALPRPALHRPSSQRTTASADPWRARRPRDCGARNVHVRREERGGGTGAHTVPHRDAALVSLPACVTSTSDGSRRAHGTGG
jgi:hypothetical protein